MSTYECVTGLNIYIPKMASFVRFNCALVISLMLILCKWDFSNWHDIFNASLLCLCSDITKISI